MSLKMFYSQILESNCIQVVTVQINVVKVDKL